ncbi:hypothetical protein [Sphingomonas sp.]|jgi:hypothetical protein|nr:hypothetical protein [Sphingomonas sp.]HEU0044255.1 hypothetical protein [Sphingomonas sp.]
MFEQTRTAQQDLEAKAKREEIIRRYWMKGELTPLAVANQLAGQKMPEPA